MIPKVAAFETVDVGEVVAFGAGGEEGTASLGFDMVLSLFLPLALPLAFALARAGIGIG